MQRILGTIYEQALLVTSAGNFRAQMSQRQSTNTILMIRPAVAGSNPETLASNSFQSADMPENCLELVQTEFDAAVLALRSAGVTVEVVQDTPEPATPDAIFPNNWFSTHGGTLVLYPMQAKSRRDEIKPAPLTYLRARCPHVIDLSEEESALEGTGSLVLDRIERKAFACLSPRTDPDLLQKWGEKMAYQVFPFHAVDKSGTAIYHTNVMLSIGTDWCVLAAETISDPEETEKVKDALQHKQIIEITQNQIMKFAGNILELQSAAGERLIAMSTTAHTALTDDQKAALTAHAKLLPIPIPTIEQVGGGSLRCMIAELF